LQIGFKQNSSATQSLKLFELLGLKLKKINNGFLFKEKPWLKPYTDLSTRCRSKAKNESEKDFFQTNA